MDEVGVLAEGAAMGDGVTGARSSSLQQRKACWKVIRSKSSGAWSDLKS